MTGKRKFTPIDESLRLKFRTTSFDAGNVYLVATLWMDGKKLVEFARIHLCLIDRPGTPEYHAWVDMVSDLFNQNLEKITGISKIKSVRRKPNYKGER